MNFRRFRKGALATTFLACGLLFFAGPLPASGDEDAPSLEVETFSEQGRAGFFDQFLFQEAVKAGPFGWVDDGLVIVVGSWNRSEGTWETASDIAEALERRFQCINEKLPGRLGQFVPEILEAQDITPAAFPEVTAVEVECQEAVGFLLPNQEGGGTFRSPSGEESFFVFAELNLDKCTSIVPDDSVSFCSSYEITADPVSVTFLVETEPVISPLPDFFNFSPVEVGAAAVGASVLVLLVGLPSQLVGSSLENAWPVIERSQIFRRLQRVRPRWSLPVPVTFAVTAVVAAVLSSLAELGNVSSVAQWLTASVIWLVAFAAMSGVGLGLVSLFARRNPQDRVGFEFHPSSLLILGLTSLGSYLAGFSPPVVFGLVFGLTFGLSFASHYEGKMTFVGALYVLLLGSTAWMGYSLWIGSGGLQSDLVAQTLSALSIACISGLPISLLPLRLLDGRKIADWRRSAQLLLWVVSISVFLLLAVQPGEPVWQTVDNLSVWIATYLGFAFVAVVTWFVLWRMASRHTTEAEADESDARLRTPKPEGRP